MLKLAMLKKRKQLAYKPLKTPLLSQVEQLRESGRPWVPVNGLEHLPEQGIAQFQLMTGRTAPRHLMRAEVLRNYIDETGKHLQIEEQTRQGSISSIG